MKSRQPGAPQGKLAQRQALTVALLVVGYAGYYLCRSTFSVNLPLLVDELIQSGMSADVAKVRLGTIASASVLAYAIGKFISGGTADFIGGRRSFLAGMFGSVLFSLMFAAGASVPVFTLAWVGNRFVQSAGWVGMVKLSARWFSHSAYGSVMAAISLSYLFGDAAARAFLAWLLAMGLSWRQVFVAAAAVLLAIFIVTFALLRESPGELGFGEPHENPDNLFAASDDDVAPRGLRELLIPFLHSPAFWLVCLLSLGVTLVRETFNTWTPTYFSEALGLSRAEAASRSAWFPFFGGISVLLAGFISDRLNKNGRAWIIFCGLSICSLLLCVLGTIQTSNRTTLPVVLVASIAFMLIGPYSYLAGAIALDFGGKRGSATACGIIDGVGYLGGVLAGEGFARATVRYGWQGAFLILAAVTTASAALALLFLLQQRTGR